MQSDFMDSVQNSEESWMDLITNEMKCLLIKAITNEILEFVLIWERELFWSNSNCFETIH